MPPSANEPTGLAHIEDDVVAEGPIALFNRWRAEAVAAKLVKSESAVISTATKDGRVSMRTVCWRLMEQGRFVFLTDSHSKKCRELEENPKASVAFLWIHPNSRGLKLARQVRLDGQIRPVDTATVEAIYNEMLPHYSVRSHLCKQGTIIDVEEQRQRYNQLKNRQQSGETFPMPDHVVGYELIPDTMEFYEDEAYKVGDRVVFTRQQPDESPCCHTQTPNLWDSFHISA